MVRNLVIIYFGWTIFLQPVDISYSPISKGFCGRFQFSHLSIHHGSNADCFPRYAQLTTMKTSRAKIVTLKFSSIWFFRFVLLSELILTKYNFAVAFSLNIFPRILKYLLLRLPAAIRKMVIFLVCSVNIQTI